MKRDINKMVALEQGQLKKAKEKKRIEQKYLRNGKNVSTATEELKQRLVAISSWLERYKVQCKHYHQNHMFHINQKQFYNEISDNAPKTQPIPDNTESSEFWSALWPGTSL